MGDHILVEEVLGKRVAFLVDFENCGGTLAALQPDLPRQLCDAASFFVGRAYAVGRDFGEQVSRHWKELVEFVDVPASNLKNSADIQMAIDATSLALGDAGVELDAFVLTTSDGDFVPLVTELKRRAKEVVLLHSGPNEVSNGLLEEVDRAYRVDDPRFLGHSSSELVEALLQVVVEYKELRGTGPRIKDLCRALEQHDEILGSLGFSQGLLVLGWAEARDLVYRKGERVFPRQEQMPRREENTKPSPSPARRLKELMQRQGLSWLDASRQRALLTLFSRVLEEHQTASLAVDELLSEVEQRLPWQGHSFSLEECRRMFDLLHRSGCLHSRRRDDGRLGWLLGTKFLNPTELAQRHDRFIISNAAAHNISMASDKWARELFGDSKAPAYLNEILEDIYPQLSVDPAATTV